MFLVMQPKFAYNFHYRLKFSNVAKNYSYAIIDAKYEFKGLLAGYLITKIDINLNF
jgi:hypothetical protein